MIKKSKFSKSQIIRVDKIDVRMKGRALRFTTIRWRSDSLSSLRTIAFALFSVVAYEIQYKTSNRVLRTTAETATCPKQRIVRLFFFGILHLTVDFSDVVRRDNTLLRVISRKTAKAPCAEFFYRFEILTDRRNIFIPYEVKRAHRVGDNFAAEGTAKCAGRKTAIIFNDCTLLFFTSQTRNLRHL